MKKAKIIITILLVLYTLSDTYSNTNFYEKVKSETICVIPDLTITDLPEPYLLKNRFIPCFMILIGIIIAGLWTSDIVSGKFSKPGNFFRWKEGANLLWPHLTAEILLSVGLVAGGFGLYKGTFLGLPLSLVSLGALVYSGINSTGWVLARNGRLFYGIPMWLSLLGAVVSILAIINC